MGEAKMINDAEREMIGAMKEVLGKFGINLSQEIIRDDAGEELADYSEVINKTQERMDALNHEADELYEQTGMTQEEILEYGNNPDNFTPEEWQAIQKVKEACTAYKKEIREKLIVPGEQLNQELSQKSENTTKSSGRKRKSARRKDWLSS